MATLARWKAEAAPGGPGRVEINGQDVSDVVEAFSVTSQPGMVPVLTVSLRAGERLLEGEGIVEVLREGEDLIAFLRSVDAELLAKEAFGRLEYGGGTNAFAEGLNVLVEWAEKARAE